MSIDFDWSQTDVELLFIIPNYGRGDYIRKTIDNTLNTSVSKDKFVVLIINDGIHEDFSDLKDKNVLYFTLERNPACERNGGFSRNVAIKYSQSKLLAQRDPEILFTGDFIAGCFNNPNVLYRCGGIAHITKQDQKNKFFGGIIDEKELIQTSIKFPILEHQYVYWHYGHCLPISYFKKINGYDEDFTLYGPEDHDMYDRLIKCELQPFFDKQCSPIHLWHGVPNTSHEDMKNVYRQKQKESIIRNIGIDWGEGGIIK